MMRGALLGVLAWVLSIPLTAQAGPTVWQRANDRRVVRVERALRLVGQMLDGVSQAEGDSDLAQNFRLHTLAVAEMTGARELNDPRLLILLAQALIGADLGREDEAVSLLERALALAGPDQAWLEAEIKPLLASALRKDPSAAVRAVSAALPLVWDSHQRSALLRQRADARMAQGAVRLSATDARASLASADLAFDRALSRFTLALALERGGDLPSALHEIRLARLLVPSLGGPELEILATPGLFLFRPYDIEYATALASMSAAQASTEPGESALEMERAEVAWERYLATAPADDRWAPVVRTHLDKCRRQRALLQTESRLESTSD